MRRIGEIKKDMSWHVIFVETGFEDEFCRYTDKVKDQRYAGINYNLLVPKRKIFERKQGMKREVIKTMFPGYVLLETESIHEFFFQSKNSPYMIRFLRNDAYFQEVRKEEIERILMMVDCRGLIEISKAFVENDKVRITDGPLFGREGIIQRIDKRKGRAKVKFAINENVLLIDLGIEIMDRIT